jgi:hypothetical protein
MVQARQLSQPGRKKGVNADPGILGYSWREARTATGKLTVGTLHCGRCGSPAEEEAVRFTRVIELAAICTMLCSCGEPRFDCSADAVLGTLSTMARDRVLRIADDGYPASFDARKKAALSKATRITPRETRLLEWDANVGRMTCAARLIVDAPGPQVDTNLRRETELRYRVMRDAGEVFLVEVAYADMMAAFPARAEPAAKLRSVH